MTAASEWRVLEKMLHWRDELDIPFEILEDDRFLCSTARFESWASGRKQLRMEYFYREMRRDWQIMLEGTSQQAANGIMTAKTASRRAAGWIFHLCRKSRRMRSRLR